MGGMCGCGWQVVSKGRIEGGEVRRAAGRGQILKGLVGVGENGEFYCEWDGKQGRDYLMPVFKDPSGCWMQTADHRDKSGAWRPDEWCLQEPR